MADEELLEEAERNERRIGLEMDAEDGSLAELMKAARPGILEDL